MAFTVEDIHAVREEETKRPKLPLSDATRAGLQHVRRDGPNPGRQTFQRISLREIPDFAVNDFELQLVVAQTSYSHCRSSLPWQRIPETMVFDRVELARLMAEQLEKQSSTRPDILSEFNTTRDYMACMAAVAYFKWRMRLRHNEIAECLNIPFDVVERLVYRLKYHAHRLGMPVKVWIRPKGLSLSEAMKKFYAANPELRQRAGDRLKKANRERLSRPGERERIAEKVRRSWTPERRAAVRGRTAWNKGLKLPKWTPERRARSHHPAWNKGLKSPWSPERKAKHTEALRLARFLKTVAWA